MKLIHFYINIIIIIILIVIKSIKSQNCGIKPDEHDTRITGGKPANPGDIPWQAVIRMGLFNATYHCNGVLISENLIVTAARCVANSEPILLTVILGDHNLDTSEGTEKSFGINRIWIHPQYNGNTSEFNIAVLRLSLKVTLTNRIFPVCLPTADTNPINETAIISGWGSAKADCPLSNVLMKAKLKIHTNAECNKFLKFLRRNVCVKRQQLCGYNHRKGSCTDDIGSPFSHQRKDGKWQLIGIASRILYPCGINPTIFTRVPEFLDFINRSAFEARN